MRNAIVVLVLLLMGCTTPPVQTHQRQTEETLSFHDCAILNGALRSVQNDGTICADNELDRGHVTDVKSISHCCTRIGDANVQSDPYGLYHDTEAECNSEKDCNCVYFVTKKKWGCPPPIDPEGSITDDRYCFASPYCKGALLEEEYVAYQEDLRECGLLKTAQECSTRPSCVWATEMPRCEIYPP